MCCRWVGGDVCSCHRFDFIAGAALFHSSILRRSPYRLLPLLLHQLNVGGSWLYCPSAAELLPEDVGFVSGYIRCPEDVQDYCQTIEECHDQCSGNGNCLEGVCYCFPGERVGVERVVD